MYVLLGVISVLVFSHYDTLYADQITVYLAFGITCAVLTGLARLLLAHSEDNGFTLVSLGVCAQIMTTNEWLTTSWFAGDDPDSVIDSLDRGPLHTAFVVRYASSSASGSIPILQRLFCFSTPTAAHVARDGRRDRAHV